MKSKKELLLISLASTATVLSSCADQVTAPQAEPTLPLQTTPQTPPPPPAMQNKSNAPAEVESDSSNTTSGTAAPAATTSVFRNGSYNQTGSYTVPGGTANIQVNVTLTNDVITAVSVTPLATGETSQRLQGKFAEGVAMQTIGKRIDQIADKMAVNGSSLTGSGFRAALDKVELEARNI
jgi:hypothetical protein